MGLPIFFCRHVIRGVCSHRPSCAFRIKAVKRFFFSRVSMQDLNHPRAALSEWRKPRLPHSFINTRIPSITRLNAGVERFFHSQRTVLRAPTHPSNETSRPAGEMSFGGWCLIKESCNSIPMWVGLELFFHLTLGVRGQNSSTGFQNHTKALWALHRHHQHQRGKPFLLTSQTSLHPNSSAVASSVCSIWNVRWDWDSSWKFSVHSFLKYQPHPAHAFLCVFKVGGVYLLTLSLSSFTCS